MPALFHSTTLLSWFLFFESLSESNEGDELVKMVGPLGDTIWSNGSVKHFKSYPCFICIIIPLVLSSLQSTAVSIQLWKRYSVISAIVPIASVPILTSMFIDTIFNLLLLTLPLVLCAFLPNVIYFSWATLQGLLFPSVSAIFHMRTCHSYTFSCKPQIWSHRMKFVTDMCQVNEGVLYRQFY
jgi:hypothetical protein